MAFLPGIEPRPASPRHGLGMATGMAYADASRGGRVASYGALFFSAVYRCSLCSTLRRCRCLVPSLTCLPRSSLCFYLPDHVTRSSLASSSRIWPSALPSYTSYLRRLHLPYVLLACLLFPPRSADVPFSRPGFFYPLPPVCLLLPCLSAVLSPLSVPCPAVFFLLRSSLVPILPLIGPAEQ